MNLNKRYIPLILSLPFFGGCVSGNVQEQTRKSVNDATHQADLILKQADIPVGKSARRMSEEVGTPYIFDESVPLAREVQLPKALQANVKTGLMYSDKETDNWISLSTFAERITRATGILVSVSPDVYLPETDLLPKLSESTNQEDNKKPQSKIMVPANVSAQKVADDVVTDMRPGKGANGRPESVYGFYFPKTEAQLASILDNVTTKFHLHHRYDEATNTIYIYRLVSKYWQTKFSAASYKYTGGQMGNTVQSNDGKSLNSTTSNQLPIETAIKDSIELNSIVNSIKETIMSRAGKIYANQATGTISMTDTEENIRAADDLIAHEIKGLNRGVILKMKTIQVTRTDNADAGINLTAVLSKAFGNVPDMVINTTSPTSLVSSNGGSISLGIFSGTAANSQAVINALKEVGDVYVSTEVPFLSKNRKGIYFDQRTITSYVPNTTPAAATTGGTGGNIGLNTSQIQTGLKLSMMPTLGEDDSASISFNLDETTTPTLVPFSTGSGATLQSVEKPNYTGHQNIQDITLKSGQSALLLGFDQVNESVTNRTLGENVPTIFGGSVSKAKSRTLTLIQLTLQIVDN